MMGVCSAGFFDDYIFLSFLSLTVTGLFIILGYAAGSVMNNPRFLAWSKIEMFQIIVSVVLVFLVLGLMDMSCHVDMGQMGEFFGVSVSSGDGIYDGAENFLLSVSSYSSETINGVRSFLGTADVLSRYTRSYCEPPGLICLWGSNGRSASPYSGLGIVSAMFGMIYSTLTVSHLTVIAQLVFISLVKDGFLIAYLPLAIVLRSLPYMRFVGGALISIIIALFIIYPLLLTLESFFIVPEEFPKDYHAEIVSPTSYKISGEISKSLTDFVAWLGDALKNLFAMDTGGKQDFVLEDNIIPKAEEYTEVFGDDFSGKLQKMFGASSASFIISSFLFSFNMIAVAASAREMSRLFGEEVNLTRLMQIV